MGCALDQAAADIEKLVREPLQRDLAVRAAVLVNMYDAILAHGEQALAIDFKAFAVTFGNQARCA